MITTGEIQQTLQQVRTALGQVIVGQAPIIDGVLTGLCCGGHVLLEGLPGLGKTLLVRTLGQVLDLPFARIQCTPDVTPKDILGTAEAHGPIFTNLLLADEINRATPRTQSALLEAMQERQVTLGTTFPLPSPFIVLATQNPVEMEGTYALPEAQLDRFLLKLLVPSPSEEDLIEIAARTTQGTAPALTPVVDAQAILAIQGALLAAPVPRPVLTYATRVVLATHPDSAYATDLVKRYVLYGASPRGLQSLLLAGKVAALLDGRDTLTAADVRVFALACLRHRLVLNFEGQASGIDRDRIVHDVLRHLPEPMNDDLAAA
jgi:MoxR-like ATPase